MQEPLSEEKRRACCRIRLSIRPDARKCAWLAGALWFETWPDRETFFRSFHCMAGPSFRVQPSTWHPTFTGPSMNHGTPRPFVAVLPWASSMGPCYRSGLFPMIKSKKNDVQSPVGLCFWGNTRDGDSKWGRKYSLCNYIGAKQYTLCQAMGI